MSRTSNGARNFLGNYIAYPAQGRTGDNCLLATKVMVPSDGPIRENVGLLGSPSFEIPRSVDRDNSFAHLGRGEELARHLRAKNRHDAVTMGRFLLTRLGLLFGLTLRALAATGHGVPGPPAAVLLDVVGLGIHAQHGDVRAPGHRRRPVAIAMRQAPDHPDRPSRNAARPGARRGAGRASPCRAEIRAALGDSACDVASSAGYRNPTRLSS